MVFFKKGFGLLLIAITFCLLKFSAPTFVESFYSTNVFLSIRHFYNQLNHFFHFPISYIFLVISIAYLLFLIYRFFKKGKSKTAIFLNISNFLGILFFVFYLVWGYNYNRPTLESKLLSPLDQEIQTQELRDEIANISQKAIELRRSIIADSLPFSVLTTDKEVGKMVKLSLSESLPKFNKLISNIPIRSLPDGLLMNCGIVGQYFPFTGESNFDVGMHDIRKPVVIAHELFHAMGHCLESDCDFLAYHYMKSSNSVYIRYSAEMEYLKYLLNDLRQRDTLDFKQNLPKLIPIALKMDFDAIRENRLKYEGFFSVLGDGVNNLFLKFQGVQEGVKSYDKLVPMVYKWKIVSQKENLEDLIFKPK